MSAMENGGPVDFVLLDTYFFLYVLNVYFTVNNLKQIKNPFIPTFESQMHISISYSTFIAKSIYLPNYLF